MHRRDFLATGGTCAAHLALVGALPLRSWMRPTGEVVVRAPFAALERIADGIWAVISNPLEGDRATLSNGGLVVGSDGILAIEGFFQPEGAAWLAGQCRALTGRAPTHVAVTHYHADHANGIAGYFSEGGGPIVRATDRTRQLVLERNTPANDARSAALAGVTMVDGTSPSMLDLGGRRVRMVPHDGHTPSDLALEIEDPHVVFCGDLVWNGLFPNYVDAVPSRLGRAVRALRGAPDTTYVPGHGPLADQAAFDRYVEVIDAVEAAARAAHARGDDAAEAGSAFTLPASLGEWTFFGRTYMPRAFGAWYQELSGE